MLKIGLDFHGVIDKHPRRYSELSHVLVAAGHEVHIVTGHKLNENMKKQLKEFNIAYTHYFSIVDYHEQKAAEGKKGHEITWMDGNPYMIDGIWNRTKADYAKEIGLDIMIDDSPRYGENFTVTASDCAYLQQKR